MGYLICDVFVNFLLQCSYIFCSWTVLICFMIDLKWCMLESVTTLQTVFTLRTAWDGRAAPWSACILHWSQDKEVFCWLGLTTLHGEDGNRDAQTVFLCMKGLSWNPFACTLGCDINCLKKNSNNETKIKTSCSILGDNEENLFPMPNDEYLWRTLLY